MEWTDCLLYGGKQVLLVTHVWNETVLDVEKNKKKWCVNSFIQRRVWSKSNMFSITVTTATTVEQVHAEPIWKHLNPQTLKRSWWSANALYVNAHKVTHAHTITPTHQIIVALLGNMLGEQDLASWPSLISNNLTCLLSGPELQFPVLTYSNTSYILLTPQRCWC